MNIEQLSVDKLNEQAIVNEPVTLNLAKPKKELPKQSSLGAMMKDIHVEVASGKEEKRIELTEDTILTLWKEFLNDHKERLQNAFLTVAEKQIPKLAGEKITFTETNNVSLELLQLHKMDIVSYFRKKTTSATVHLEFKLNRSDAQNKNYKTPKERLKDMIDSNPAVLKLIQKFDLNND